MLPSGSCVALNLYYGNGLLCVFRTSRVASVSAGRIGARRSHGGAAHPQAAQPPHAPRCALNRRMPRRASVTRVGHSQCGAAYSFEGRALSESAALSSFELITIIDLAVYTRISRDMKFMLL